MLGGLVNGGGGGGGVMGVGRIVWEVGFDTQVGQTHPLG